MGTSGESMDSSKINFNENLSKTQEQESSYNRIFDNDVITKEEFNKDINSTSNSTHNKTSSTVIEFLNDQENTSQLKPNLQVENDEANSSIDDPNLIINSSEINNQELKSNVPLTSESVNGIEEVELHTLSDKLNESDISEIEASDFMANSINFAKNSQHESANDKTESTSISVESIISNSQESIDENGIVAEIQCGHSHLSNGNNGSLNVSGDGANNDQSDSSSFKYAEKFTESSSKDTVKNMTASSDFYIKEDSIHQTPKSHLSIQDSNKSSHPSINVEKPTSRDNSSQNLSNVDSLLHTNSYIVTDNATVIVKSDSSSVNQNDLEKDKFAQSQLSDHHEINTKPLIIVQSDLAPSSNSAENIENDVSAKNSQSVSLNKENSENSGNLSSILAESFKMDIESSSSVKSEASSHYSTLENSNGSLSEEKNVPIQEEIVPIQEEIVPFQEKIVPIQEEIVPLQEETAPIQDEIVKPLETLAASKNEKSPFLLLGESTPIDISDSIIQENSINESSSEPVVAHVSADIHPSDSLLNKENSREIQNKVDEDIIKPSVMSDVIVTSTPTPVFTEVSKDKIPEDTLNTSANKSSNENSLPANTPETATGIEETDKITDVFSNGLLIKEIIKYGNTSGPRALNGQLATISFTSVITKLNIEGESAENMKIVIGECDVILGLDCSLALMYPGEKAKISIDPRYAFREFRWELKNGVTIPPNSHLTYTLEIISVENFPQPTPQNLPFILSLCEAKKALGNKFFYIKDYIYSSLVYQKAIDHTEGIPEFLALNSILKNNLAFCYIVTKDFNQAVPILQSVLLQDPYNIKAALRLVECFEVNAKVDDALQIIEAISARHPNNTIIMKAQIRVLEKIKENRVKLTQMYKKMFTTLNADESSSSQEVVESTVPLPQPSFSWWKFGLSTLTISLCAFAALAYLKK